jgi:hypothetical protein
MIKSKKRLYVQKQEEKFQVGDDDTSSSASESSEQMICVSNLESQETAKNIVNRIFDIIKEDNIVDEVLLNKLIKILRQNDTDFVISVLLHFITLVSESTVTPRQSTQQFASTALVATVLRNLEQVRNHVCSINTILNKHIVIEEVHTQESNQNP